MENQEQNSTTPLFQPEVSCNSKKAAYGSVNHQVENPADYKTRWRTIRVLYLTMFFSSIGFSIVMSSIWPFLEEVDNEATPTFLGWINAAYSLSQLTGSLLFGAWCEYRSSREPLITGIVLFIGGSGLYAYVQAFPNQGGEVILFARVFLGISAGNAAVARAVVSQSTTLKERTPAMANLAIAQASGFIFGPAMQAACVPLGGKGIYIESIKMYLNIYTAPGYLGIIMGLINILAIVFFYRERKVDIYSGQGGYNIDAKTLTKPDPWAIFLSTLLFFVILTVFALNETIITPLLMDEFAWTKTDVVLYGGILLAGSGVVAIVAFQVVKPLSAKFGERNVLAAGLMLILAGFVTYLPWGNEFPALQISSITEPNNGTAVVTTPTTAVGCPSSYGWCTTTPKIYLPQFLVGATLIGIGYPVAFLVINTIYSRIIGPRPQGMYMGWITAIGSLARCIGPIVVTIAYVKVGPRWTFLGVNIMLTLAILIYGLQFDKLVPFHDYARKKKLAPVV